MGEEERYSHETSDSSHGCLLFEATEAAIRYGRAQLGITELNPVGQPFDANQHEAMVAQESATAEPGSVLAVVQRGYTLNGRLLRAARVVVAKAPGG